MKQNLTYLLRFLIIFLIYHTATAQVPDKKITLPKTELTGLTLVKAIKNQAGLRFNYGEAIDADLSAPLKIAKQQISVKEALELIKTTYDISYEVSGEYITLLQKSPSAAPVPKKVSGRVTGKIIDEESGQPVVGATIRIGNKGITTDENGVFTITLPKGKYEAEISFVGYGVKKVTDILIKEGETFILNIPLKRVKGQLGTVTVSARRIKETGTNASLVNEIREANAVMSGISKEQITRSQDRDAAEVVRRIPGVSVIQNRFIVIRGMGQRYNTVLLNNVIAPSFEPDSRAFSFDIIPSGMIDRIMVYKTALPELPGDFAGGVVKVYTTDVPVKNSFNISYSSSYRPGTTFKDFYGQKDGKYAWLGYDDGTYKKPIDYILPQSSDFNFRMDATRKFNQNWEAENKGTALPDQRFGIEFARRISLSNKSRLGLAGGLGYTYSKQYERQYRNPRTSAVVDSGTTVPGGLSLINAVDEIYDRDVRLSGLLNFSVDLGTNHRISFKNLYTHLGSTRNMYRKGWLPFDAMADIGVMQGDNLEQFVQINDYRGIYSGQLNGSHQVFKGNTSINWLAAFTNSDFYAPDERRRTHSAPAGTTKWGPWILGSSAGLGVQGRDQRVFMTGKEDVKTLGMDVTQKLAVLTFTPIIKAGFYYEDKEKSSSYTSYIHIDSALVGGAEGGFNTYEAYNILKAGYLSLEIPFLKKFKLQGGIRIEDNLQHMGTTSRDVVGPNAGPVLLNLKKTSILPSVNLMYNVTEKTLFRTAYYKTLNRPEFREISSIQYYDMANNSYVYGNPQLLSQADIDNLDLRIEHYPGPGEMISFALFHKKIVNPYELYAGGSTSGVSYIWRNSKEARNYGAEVDLMLGMGRYFGGGSWVSGQLQKFTVLFNAAYIYSRLKMDKSQREQQGSDYRPLMGQSPYLINASLNYTDDSAGLKMNLSYNIVGKRIYMVGTRAMRTVWELPRHSLDLSFSQRISKLLELKGGIQNILNSRSIFAQDMNMDNRFDIKEEDGEAFNLTEYDNRYQSMYKRPYYTLGIGLHL